MPRKTLKRPHLPTPPRSVTHARRRAALARTKRERDQAREDWWTRNRPPGY